MVKLFMKGCFRKICCFPLTYLLKIHKKCINLHFIIELLNILSGPKSFIGEYRDSISEYRDSISEFASSIGEF